MCFCGCRGENSNGNCRLGSHPICSDEDEENDSTIDDQPEDEIEPTEQEISDAEDKYFNKD